MITFLLSLLVLRAVQVEAASRTSPPSGALVVQSGTTTSGRYTTLSSAVAALPNDGSDQSIFIYPGTYNEQVYIDIDGPLTVCYNITSLTLPHGVSADLWLHGGYLKLLVQPSDDPKFTLARASW